MTPDDLERRRRIRRWAIIEEHRRYRADLIQRRLAGIRRAFKKRK